MVPEKHLRHTKSTTTSDKALIEIISAAADELSDYQDRVMNEAYLATARTRVSIARHARLLEYLGRALTCFAAVAISIRKYFGPRRKRGDSFDPLQEWTFRSPDDPGTVLMENASILADILAFYQKLYADRTYSRIPQWRESIQRLIELTGSCVTLGRSSLSPKQRLELITPVLIRKTTSALDTTQKVLKQTKAILTIEVPER